ncbi:MAG: FeoA family protein [Anaerolineae bacterium]|nr:FeoA family protein [Anaerolineae bacterium]
MVPLADLHMGSQALIHSFEGGHNFIARLAALGFTPGAPVKVMRNHGIGPMIVAIRGTRIALGRGEARRIWVYTADESDSQGEDL